MSEKNADDALFSAMVFASSDLKALGKGEIGYIRKYKVRNQAAFVLHAADGTALAVQKDESAAENAASFHDLEIVSVH